MTMTKIVDCETWEDFLEKLSELDKTQKSDDRLLPDLLFRGQANASWKLETTLDRNDKKEMKFSEYYRLIAVLQSEIEAFTEHRWKIPYFPDIINKFCSYDFVRFDSDLHTSIYGYMAHLRHHNFPSPLLDWTRSAYIAAYFAFAEISAATSASIYVMSQARMTSGSSVRPQIQMLGPNVRTHKRHFLQQCEYSLCMHFNESWQFADHETAFEARTGTKHPVNSAIYKFNISRNERVKILRLLERMNLNAFSLFGSEESLMETLAIREMTLAPE